MLGYAASEPVIGSASLFPACVTHAFRNPSTLAPYKAILVATAGAWPRTYRI